MEAAASLPSTVINREAIMEYELSSVVTLLRRHALVS